MARGRPADGPTDKFLVRMPTGMREEIAERAKKNRRTMTAEVIGLLEQALQSQSYSLDRVREPQGPTNRVIRLAETVELGPGDESNLSEEEQMLVGHYRALAIGTRTPIQALLQALANQRG